MVSTFQALAVAVFAILPGALYTFSYERLGGSFGIAFADRIIRFLGSSALLHALLAGATYRLYSRYVLTGRLARGEVAPGWIELLAVLYVAVPILVGVLIGHGRNQNWSWVSIVAGRGPEPRAWDYLWRRNVPAIVRLRLKSGAWLSGVFAERNGVQSYASGYPEEGDLFLSAQLAINDEDGTFLIGPDGGYQYVDGENGLLVRWAEVEYLDYQEWK